MSADDTVRTLVERHAAVRPAAVYAISPETGRTLTFGELLHRSQALAALLAAYGVRPGDHVAWLLPNGLQVVRLFVGAMAAGCVATPLSLIAQPAQLAHVIDHSDCKALFVGPEHRGVIRDAVAGLQRRPIVFEADPDAPEIDGEASATAWATTAPGAHTPALLMYTSGTTGRPKGVLLTHANVCAGARNVSAAHALGGGDRVLAVLPMYHINAQVVTVLAPLHHGGSLVMPRRFSASAFWKDAAAHKCTWLNVVPTIIARLLDHGGPEGRRVDLARVRFCRSASAPLPPEHQRAFERTFGIGIVETMGLTETAAPVFSNPIRPALRRVGSPGKAFGCKARIIDPASGDDLPIGVAGEIVVRGENVCTGYYKAPEETAAAFTADGWLRTGDLGYRDADGFFFVTGRLKELIIKGGENIAPREVDEALLAHPAVAEAAAVGVPDRDYGQEIAAGVVLRAGVQASEAELLDYCRRLLGPFKAPARIRFLPQLPKGPSGKVQRLQLVPILGEER